MLLELSSFSKVPGTDCVVQATCPQLGTIGRDVYTACPVCVTLELPHQGLVVKVPDSYVAVTAATEAHLGVRAHG